jgi:hypothetical protein
MLHTCVLCVVQDAAEKAAAEKAAAEAAAAEALAKVSTYHDSVLQRIACDANICHDCTTSSVRQHVGKATWQCS